MVGVSTWVIVACTIKVWKKIFLAPTHPGDPSKGAIKWLCVYVCFGPVLAAVVGFSSIFVHFVGSILSMLDNLRHLKSQNEISCCC